MQGIVCLELNDMKSGHVLFMLYLILTTPVASQSPVAEEVRQVVALGTDALFQQKYEEAEDVFRSLAEQHPDHPAGFLFQAGILQAIAMDYDLMLNRAEFDSLLELAEERAGQMIANNPQSASGYFFRGSAYGYDAYASAESGDWWRAINKSSASVDDFEEALARDSTLYDALVGIGTYYYWRSRRTQFLNWLPFISDDREEGIRLVRVAAEKGVANRYTAMASLISIYLDADELEKALEIASKALDRYPGNRIFLWGKATALERLERWDDAFGVFRQLLRVMEQDSHDNPYNKLVCVLKLANISHRLKNDDEAFRYLSLIVDKREADYPRHLQDRAEDKLDAARELMGEINELRQ